MARLMYASIETNSENRALIQKYHSFNRDGFCTVLYFEGTASKEEIAAGLRYVRSHRAEFQDAPEVAGADDFDYKERATALSTKAGWCRYECYGSCYGS